MLNAGYDVPLDTELARRIHRHLIEHGPAEYRLIVRRTGWYGRTFVLPDTRQEGGSRVIVFQAPATDRVGNFEQRGTLEGWQNGVAAPALASSRLMLAIAMAFAAPLLRFIAFDSCGLHLEGESSKGKTTCLLAAASASGKADRRELLTWDVTQAGLAETAMGHNDSLMCIDELGNAKGDPAQQVRQMRETAYMLASGRGRTRSKVYGIQRSVSDASWRVLFLSSGEKAIVDLASEAALQRMKGEEVRLIDVPAIVGQDLGIYERLPDGFTSPAAVSEAIEAACRDHHGVALRRFVQQVAERADTMEGDIEALVDRFMDRARVPSGGWERRFARPFSLCYAGARLAVTWGILPWSPSDCGRAIKKCYVAARGRIPDMEDMRTAGIARLRDLLRGENVLRLHRRGAAVDWTPEQAEAAEVFRTTSDSHGPHFLIKPGAFKGRFDAPTADLLLKWLETEDHLIKEADRNICTIQAKVKGVDGRCRYYAVKTSVLRDEPRG
jgi:putative DNA primase/helicase